MFHSIRLGTFCPDNTRSGVAQESNKFSATADCDVQSNVVRGRREGGHASKVVTVDDDDQPLDSEIKEWLSCGNDMELWSEECKGPTSGKLHESIDGWSEVDGDELASENAEQRKHADSSSSYSSSSSSEDSGTSDDEMLMKGSSDHGGVVEWKPGCVIHQLTGRRRLCIYCQEDRLISLFAVARLGQILQCWVVAFRRLNGDAGNVIEEGLFAM